MCARQGKKEHDYICAHTDGSTTGNYLGRQRLGPQTIHMYIHASASRGAMLLSGTFKFSEHVHLLTHKQNIWGKRIFREYGRGERRESWFSEF